MKNLISALLASFLLVAGSQSALAQKAYDKKSYQKSRPTYTFAGVKYLSQKLDDFDCTQDGIVVDSSYDFGNPLFARASFSDVSGDSCGSSSLKVGAGYKAAWGASSHVYGLLSFVNTSPDLGEDDTGLAFGGGIRGYVSPGIEAYFEVEHTTVFDGDTSASFGGAYWVNQDFSITGDASIGAEQSSLAIGGRFNF